LLTEEESRIASELDPHYVRKVELEARGPENQKITIQITSGILNGYLFGFVRDITEMKNAYKALEVSEKKYSTLVQAAQAGIMTVDPNEKITFVNKAQAEMLGFELEELVGRNLAELTTPEHFEFIKDKTLERKKGQFGFYETQLFCKDGILKNIGV